MSGPHPATCHPAVAAAAVACKLSACYSRARLRLQSISQDATPCTLSDVTFVISFSASHGDAVILWTATEMAVRQDRQASAQLLQCCCKRRDSRRLNNSSTRER
eukprot:366564-Chlamydomonas_euryale.AAC.18